MGYICRTHGSDGDWCGGSMTVMPEGHDSGMWVRQWGGGVGDGVAVVAIWAASWH